jgi:hypothetical protein
MRELNAFNKIVIEKFSSLQAYQIIKGHYIPIKMTNITDESVMDVEKRKYYIQSYEFLMMGFLIDENEFEVSPAVNRVLQVLEVDERKIKRQKKVDYVPSNYELNLNVRVGTNIVQQKFDYTANVIVGTLENISLYDVYINNDFFGTNISNIQMAYEARNVILNKRGAFGVLSPDGKDITGNTVVTKDERSTLQKDFQNYGLKSENWQIILAKQTMKWVKHLT